MALAIWTFFASLQPGGISRWLPFLLLISGYFFGIMNYLIDSYDLNRHILTIILPQKAVGWLLICFLLQDLSGGQRVHPFLGDKPLAEDDHFQ